MSRTIRAVDAVAEPALRACDGAAPARRSMLEPVSAPAATPQPVPHHRSRTGNAE
ncbi:hypothetical protein [Pseudonocardia sp. GCM10023141]|uniref:hypothetical protein n=1 Tax=Pseudonocardia sp. GCM10023141 TaxID=3252653 RepID=UPI003622A778